MYAVGEQALFLKVKGKWLVILSGYANVGIIVNTVKHVRRIAGADKIHAVIGGFHLANEKPKVIQNTVAVIIAMNPDYIVLEAGKLKIYSP